MIKRHVLFLLFNALLLVGCGGNSSVPNSSSSSSESSEDLTSLSTKELLMHHLTNVKEENNYTISYTDSDGKWTRRYTEKAFYCKAPNTIDTIGYVETEEGIFSYKITDGVASAKSSYLLDDDGNNLHGLYTCDYNVDASLNNDKEKLANSFELMDISIFNDVEEEDGGFFIDFDLIPYFSFAWEDVFTSSAQFSSKTLLFVKPSVDGIMFMYYNTNYGIELNVKVDSIGNTQINEIDEYLANGGGPLTE